MSVAKKLLDEGKAKLGVWEIETPTLIRYGELTNDEFFVNGKAPYLLHSV